MLNISFLLWAVVSAVSFSPNHKLASSTLLVYGSYCLLCSQSRCITLSDLQMSSDDAVKRVLKGEKVDLKSKASTSKSQDKENREERERHVDREVSPQPIKCHPLNNLQFSDILKLVWHVPRMYISSFSPQYHQILSGEEEDYRAQQQPGPEGPGSGQRAGEPTPRRRERAPS